MTATGWSWLVASVLAFASGWQFGWNRGYKRCMERDES